VFRLGIDIPLSSLFGGITAATTIGPAVASARTPPAPSPSAQQVASLTPLPAEHVSAVAPRRPSAPLGGETQRFTIRFDDRLAALSPGGVCSLDEAVLAIRAGDKVEIAIDGCAADADHSDGSPCARRAMTLRQLLAQREVSSPRR
jgi:hypothetical protein